MYISTKDWKNYIDKLSRLNNTAGRLMSEYITKNGLANTEALLDYAYALVTKYGEGSAALSAEMYDAIAVMSGKTLPPAEVAPIADYGEVAKAVQGTIKKSKNPNSSGSTVSRLVKQAGADTILKNAKRDGAQFAWVPMGDTCAFCLTLASRGWQYMSRKALRNGHAEHIHANCDCNYSVRFDDHSGVKGYDPDKYLEMYESAEGDKPKDKINSLRRMQYAKRKDAINAQKRAAYAVGKEPIELYRKIKNIGVYSHYDELMSKKHVHEVVSDMGLSPDDVRYAIDRNEKMIGTGYMGHTSDDGRTITLYPDAFTNREQLVKTIGHENTHLNQIRKNGKVKVHQELIEREEEAVASERIWWAEYVKKTGYR